MPENASFKEEFAEVNFDTSEENQLSYFQKGYFFKILWGCHEPYNEVKCRKKIITISGPFINKFFILLL